MPYYCNYGGAGGFTSPTLGNLITGSPKVKVVIDKFSFVGNDSTQRVIFWQGGLTASLRELVFRKNGTTDYQLIVGGTVTSVMTNAEAATLYGSSAMTCDEWAVELDGTTVRMYKDGAVVKTVTGISRGTGRLADGVFRIGCAPQTDTPANLASQFFAGANSTYGDIQVYINDVLVRSYVTPSTGTTIPDSVGGNTASQTGTWPAGDGEWVFYSSGASNTVTVSATLPKITGSLTLNEINPSYVISVSGQLPKITGAVTLNEINPVFTVAVAGQLPKLTGSIALNQFANNRQAAVNGVLPKLTGAVTLNRIQPNNQAAVSGQLPRITASITLRVPDSYPAANPNDYTVSAYLSTDSTYTARLSESSTINAIISTETTYAARLN